MRRAPLRRGYVQRDPVTADLREFVLRRDGGCVAARLAAPDGCRSRTGYPMPPDEVWRLELDHVKDAPMLGKRAPSDADHLVALCHHHHQGGWATRNRPLMRVYLAAVRHLPSYEAARAVLADWQRENGRAQT